MISIPIINDNQYEADVDFYVILKNAHGGAGIGDPSVTRITIVDDDGKSEGRTQTLVMPPTDVYIDLWAIMIL